ncbi:MULTISPECIES: LysR family transcriptional regulator [unclassified Acinetobacter]|uniref:LysR family transcriptional regulator n=1 Tax=unclassified Acinetobacter TaxID=196816 RepID=UPI00190B461A|nr:MULTISPECIES: LysR family transcriptional regulator [unclassified Acinetobacter]MBK0063213.1 LysR family transcriptional regulator [Acinetobacter sp. S55]MBK0066875.1 LysR family transcriptional regulator [Acinetobacter sp. S54]
MDIKALKIFVQIIQSQSFTTAAEQLFMTQPTVSKAIAALEQEMGTTLFKKGDAGRKREVELTYTGQQIYQHALKILDEQKKIYETLQDIKHLKKGKLTLGLPPLGSVLLTSLIALFHKQYPNIELQFMEVGSNAISEAILNRTLDVGVLLNNQNPILAEIPIIDSPLCLVSSPDSKWKGCAHVELIDLKDQDFLFYDDRFALNKLILEATQKLGFMPHIVCKSSQWDFIVKMVEHRMGIALIPQIYCEQLDPIKFNISLIKDTPVRWKLTMAWNTSVPMTAAAKAWLDIVKTHQDEIHF